jgi:hypothetical protein
MRTPFFSCRHQSPPTIKWMMTIARRKLTKSRGSKIKRIENQLLDLARAIQEAGELLLDLPLALITTKICPFLPTRRDWNNLLLVKKLLRLFAKTALISTLLPPWPLFPRPSSFVHLEILPYQYSLSPNGQFFAFFAAPPGLCLGDLIRAFSRRNGYLGSLPSHGPCPFYQIHFKQTHDIVVPKPYTRVITPTLEDRSEAITDVSGNMMTTTTYVQSLDAAGHYLEWKLFPSRRDYAQEPNSNQWNTPALGAVDAPVATFSDDGTYLL